MVGVALGDSHLTYGTAWRAWTVWSPVTPRHFAWQAWHLVTGHIHLRFAWQAWHLMTSTFVSRGRRGTWSHPPSFCVAGVAWHWAGSGGALGPVLVAGDAAALCVAGVALGDIHLRFTWQVWHVVTSAFVLRGRRGTYGTGLALVARLGRFWSPVTPRHFAWQAWHLVTSTFVSRGRCWSLVTPWHFAWQAWHLVTSTFVSRSFSDHLLHTIFGTQLLHTIFDTQLCHTPPFTYHLSHTMLDTPSFTHHL